MSAQLAILIAILVAQMHVTPLNAKYIARHRLGLDQRKGYVGWVNPCTQPPANNEPPALWYYMDGDTPATTAYSDYREDLQWYQNENPQVCTIEPEADPHDNYAILFEDGSGVDLQGNNFCLPNWPCEDLQKGGQ